MSNVKNSDEIEKQVESVMLQEIVQSANMIYDSLVVNQTKGKLPEEIFQNHFLPYFSGEKPIGSDSKVMEQWISIAGTAMSEVDIVNPKGETLFTVPSMFDTNMIDIVKRDKNNSFNSIYTNYEVRANRIPAEGRKYLADALGDKIDNINNQSKVNENNADRWNGIFKRYGKENVNEANNNRSSSNGQNADDFEY